MILQDFIAINEKGIYCLYGDFYLDPKEPVATAVISHAHADHAVSGNRDVYCTEATSAFMQLRYGKNAALTFHILGWQQQINIGGVEVSFLPAGHMLGSAMVLMVYQGVRYLYTGDFKLQPDATCEPIQFCQADVLITESTFADPNTAHPDAGLEIKKLADIDINIMLGAYGLGKSQRLIQLINQHVPDKTILVPHKIWPLNAIYEKFGYQLGNYQIYSRKLMKEQRQFVYIVPPFTFDSYIRATGVKRLFASGWKNLQVNDKDTLYISDHADWNDILKAIEQVSPKEAWTLHGDGNALKQHFDGKLPVKIMN
ncbi:MBL fold metallo-hydrolase [Mucilaginibacter ginkgonis]|uniref:Exonuclease n=1 Tax=Mucilaginibacter ginkgonis TaxID=2682091 RepID=A0A6I4I209_9SPHI|nr:MBL fold metallo-hydrolase [Mucilaginibacter ginkgonis]QQL50778.1 exonuclease [Mucilaginibacter ginkgonis]